ncbi:zinc finger matrin-type protein 5 [Danaus plexippus plexippus]|uniref:Zinc finger matrin-type protein 5 n=1 Tax=Danaus plexippus plexippus TaxID=278856 RepID=A0A212FEL1_DANPL|nr:zinc finger matrin-type protein 5 [Danaus plexippus plexippus]
MGKKYYCDYCEKTMSSAPLIIKTHNKGMAHQKLVGEHYKQFKDAKTILEEENNKKPCLKYLKGECHFGTMCRFSHYTRDELCLLKQIVDAKNNVSDSNQPSFKELYDKLQSDKCEYFENKNALVDKNGITHMLPWNYNVIFEQYGDKLPPSLRKFKTDDFINVFITEWGDNKC